MKRKRSACPALNVAFCFLLSASVFAQSEIPLGTWRMHLSFNTVGSLAVSDAAVYGATESGIVAFDKSDQSFSVISKLNGLNATGITCLAFDNINQQLLVGYQDGNLDIIKDNEVINFDRLKNLNNVTESKAIHHIAVRFNLAYLATDFGVVVFDLAQLEIKETWRDLGANGTTLKILETTFQNDTIFLATEKGVITGNLNTNLLDFNNWKRFDSGDFINPVTAITVFGNKVYGAIGGKGIYTYQQGVWTKENFLQTETFNELSATSANLLIATTTGLWQLSAANELTAVVSEKITAPLSVRGDGAVTWVGDATNGLLANAVGNFESYVPNGPSIASAFRLKYIDGKLFALQGGYSSTGSPLNNPGKINTFADGLWETSASALRDITDVDFIDNELFVASFRDGVQRTDISGDQVVFDHTNSTLQNALPAEKSVFISALERSGSKLLVANYGVSQPLNVFSNGSWQSHSFPIPPANYPLDIAVDFLDNVWMRVDPTRGGGIVVYNPQQNSSQYLTDIVGNGGLPSREVLSIASDRDGVIWAGTAQGVVYFTDPDDDAIFPIFENRFLLRDERITAIDVDGGNRKWIGTERGVWLFNPTGDELILNFTEENSPLLSDIIRDVEAHPVTGEVFFSTDKGIVSYRSDATTASPAFGDLKIFPNPVTGNFTGTVGISGLASDAIVKITDISGKLIWQTQASGGTAAWNVRDYNGRRAATGIYLVFAATENGSESVVGKIAVVE